MDQENERSLFDMSMDAATQSHLLAVTKWSKFIAITGFIIGGLLLILMAVYGEQIILAFSTLLSIGDTRVAGVLIAVVLIGLALVCCWLYFLLRSSRLLKKGLESRDMALMAEGFKALRVYFVFSFIMSLLSILSTFSTII